MKSVALIWTGAILGVVGWLGLVGILSLSLPSLAPRWFFFFFLMLALSGTAIPLIYMIYWRLGGQQAINSAVITREAILVGIYGNLITWLLQGRVFTLATAFFLAFGFILIDYLLRLRERSRWKPRGTVNE
jgi:hypothetical protein